MITNWNTLRLIRHKMGEEAMQIDSSPIKENSSLNFRRFEFDSDSEDEGSNLVEKLEKRRQKKRELTHNPMSSPVRRRSTLTRFPTRACKYTLRSAGYIPFRKRLEEKRAMRQLEQRGGSDEMERFIHLRQEKEARELLRRDAEKHSVELNETFIEDQLDLRSSFSSSFNGSHVENADYQKELERMLQEQEEDDLDELIAKLDLN